MKKGSMLINLLKLFGMLILGYFLWLFIFAVFSPREEEISDLHGKLAIILGAVTGLVMWVGSATFGLRKSQQMIEAGKSNIKVVQERAEGLLDKANRVVDKYMAHEGDTHKDIAKSRGRVQELPKKIKSATEFRVAIESYPELQANESVMKLLEQIQNCENTVANFKLAYNEDVANYNAKVFTMPGFLRNMMKFKEAKYYDSEEDKANEITDDMLGI